MSQKTGRVTVKIDGQVLTSKKGASMMPGGIKREPMMSDQGTFHDTEEWEHSIIKATLIHVAETDLTAIRAFRGTLSYETDTGVTFSVPEAVFTEMGELSDGEVEVTFAGAPAVEA